jgi:hypothetical protein
MHPNDPFSQEYHTIPQELLAILGIRRRNPCDTEGNLEDIAIYPGDIIRI